MKTAGSVLDLMKESPLVALRGRRRSPPRAALWGKLELALPGGMKDRVALRMVEDAEARGELRPGGIVLESSSGTLAEGLARVGSVKGYRVIIVTDPRLEPSAANRLRALGAELEIVERYHPDGGWQQSRLERLREILHAHPGACWTRQYDNPSNANAYVDQMAGELLTALDGRVTALVGSVGSGGSLCGTARGLLRSLPGLRVVAVDAVGSGLFHQPLRPRLQSGHGNNIVAGNIDYEVIDEVHWIADGEAFAACRELARREGIYAGGSSGAVYVAASWLARTLEPDDHVVAILPDRGDRYAETIFSDSFLEGRGLAGDEAEAADEPREIRYGLDVAERWSRAPLPRHGEIPYHAAQAVETRELTRELGL